jgi:predicted nucleic acid-binding protein
MEQYLIDTNVVCDYFSNSFAINSIRFLDNIIDSVPNLSIITQIELLSWKIDNSIAIKVEGFIGDSIIHNINSEVVKRCVELRRNKKIKTPDAIIAATALAKNYILITNNEKDFANIEGLKIINPHKQNA